MIKTWLRALTRKPGAPRFTRVWDTDREAIWHWMLRHPACLANTPDLPDEPDPGEEGLRWAPGALDGTLAFHFGQPDGQEKIHAVIRGIQAVLSRPADPHAMQALYEQLLDGYPLSYLDDLLAALANVRNLSATQLQHLAWWLAKEAPDRNVVKVAMALMAYFPGEESIALLTTLGGHDEFTLYAIVALRGMLSRTEYDSVWLGLAHRVEGWGRIHLIERLPDPLSDTTRHWLLRSGCHNTVMDEYTAWHCATSGRLAEALETTPDSALLLGAATIIQALVSDGPAKGMADYEDGASACERYLSHLEQRRADNLTHYLCAQDMATWSAKQAGEEDDENTAARWRDVSARAQALILREDWATCIQSGFASDDPDNFALAVRAASRRGEDPWPAVFDRQRRFPNEVHWYTLLQTQNDERAQQAATLAEQQLNLASLATGPALKQSAGPEGQAHRILDGILYNLQPLPGIGWPLVKAGLFSPMVHNRNMALQVLDAWHIPGEAIALLKQLRRQEPHEELRQHIDELLSRSDPA